MTFGAGFGFPRARFPMGAAPTLNMDFAGTAALPPYVTFSRGTNATYVDSLGNIAYAPSNLLTYSEQFDNAAWSNVNISVSANAVVAPNGTTTADILARAADGSATRSMRNNATTTAIGTYTFSCYVQPQTGTRVTLRCQDSAAVGGHCVFDLVGEGSIFLQVTSTGTITKIGDWYRISVTVALTGTFTGIQNILYLGAFGTSVDPGSIATWGAQLNLDGLQPYNSTTVKNLLGYTQDFDNAAWTKSNSFIQTNLLTYSEQFENAAWSKFGIAVQTNQIRNNTMQGAVAGTPGTAPTNTSIVTGGGISSQIVSVGAEDGVNYYDVRFFGTGSSVAAERVYLETPAIVAASTGQTWSLSAYLKLVSGVVPAGLFVGVDETGPGTTYIKTDQNNLSITSTLLRYNYSWALSGGANVAFILPQIGFNSAIGVAVDFTIRIGLPQLVLGAASGDVVRTYGTAMPVMYQSPVNTLAADKIIETFTNGQHLIQTITPASAVVGISYTLSAYAKAGERSELAFTSFGEPTAVFDLLTGTVSVTGGLVCSITDAGGGWYRCSATFVKANVNGWYYIGLWQSGSYTYPGNGVSGLYLWGAQVVQGATPGDYQATTTAALAVQYRAPDGSLTADKLVEDTATGFHRVVPAASSTVVAGGVITTSVYAKQEGRTAIAVYPYSSAAGANFNLATGTVISTSGGVTAQIVDVGNGWYRCSASIVAPATSAAPWILPLGPANATSYTGDGTSGIYIWGAQLSDSASLDPYSYNFTTAPTAAAYYGPRFDYDPVTLACKGLLIEEQRTNSIRNNTMQGAVAGTPGTLPTNWFTFTSLTGLTQQIVGTGTDSGITYIDIRLSGTPSGAGQFGIYFENTTSIAASNGQTWAQSAFLKLQSGSFAGVTDTRLQLDERTASAYIRTNPYVVTITSAALNTQRFSYAATLTGGVTVANILPYAAFYLNGVAIDITLRIGLPQLELGAFATSVIPTTTTAVTRAADVAVIQGANFSNWYNQSEGTFYADAAPQTSNANGYTLVEAGDGTASNRLGLFKLSTSGNASFAVLVGGFTQVSTNNGAWPVTGKLVGAYKLDDFASAFNGGVVVTDTSGSLPVATQLTIGRRQDSAAFLNGHIARIAYYPTRQPDPTLQAITT